MCIRDRNGIGVTIDKINLASDLSATLIIQIQDLLSKYKVCLLYTSDAADERSSVDLGGRRIIKKKKKSMMWWCHILKKINTAKNSSRRMKHKINDRKKNNE